MFDPIKFDSYLPASKSLFNQPSATSQSSKLEHEVWSNFEKFQSLADQLQIIAEKAYIQYQLESLPSTIPSTPLSKTTVFAPPSSSLPTQPIVILVRPPPVFVAIFAPLQLPGHLAALPHTYGQRLPLFDGISRVTAHEHIDKMVDFIDLEKVDDDDAKTRLMAQIFPRDVKKWFCGLAAGSIDTPQRLNELFLARWREKNNLLQILAEYNTLKRNPNKTIQEFAIRFNQITIPFQIT